MWEQYDKWPSIYLTCKISGEEAIDEKSRVY